MKTFDQIREELSAFAQHGLEDHERKDLAKYMKKTHGVKTKYKGDDELTYHGTKKQLRGALDDHYGADNASGQHDMYPHIYK